MTIKPPMRAPREEMAVAAAPLSVVVDNAEKPAVRVFQQQQYGRPGSEEYEARRKIEDIKKQQQQAQQWQI